MRKGFTLVELAIVLVIIGLLIGGILVAQSMISTAKVIRTIHDIDQYKIAIRLFQSRFNCLPGDCANATNYFVLNDIPEADWYSNNGNGNGDGIIAHGVEREDLKMWKELNQSDLLPGNYYGSYKNGVVDSSGNPLVVPGMNIPAGPYPNTGWEFLWSYVIYPGTLDNGLLLGTAPSAYNVSYDGLAPADAAAIDAKMDDGLPNTGNVAIQQNGGGWKNCRQSYDNSANILYDPSLDPSVSANRCSLFFNTATY